MARQSDGAWYRSGKDCWYATVEGRKISLGVKGKQNKKAAQEAWHRLMADGAGRLRASKPAEVEKRAEATAGAVADGFLADARVRVKPNTLAAYTGLLKLFTDHFGELPVSELTATKLVAFTHRPEWGSSHRHNLIGTVATAFKWAIETGLIEGNPLIAVKRPPKASRGTKAIVDDSTHLRLLDAATPSLRLLLTLLHETGARPSELSRLTAAEVDLKNGVVMLSVHKTADSTGKPRMIILTPTAIELLAAKITDFPTGELLRNERGSKWTKDGIGLAVRRARKKAGVSAIAYGYRHTYATNALAKGVPDAQVAALLGHSSTTMLHKHYSHLTSQAGVLRSASAMVRPGVTPEQPEK
jgi:integrase